MANQLKLRRIVGPPGCGKTTRLAKICQHAASHYGSEAVCVMSLTRAAAAAVTNKQIDGQRIPVPKNNIGTLHAFAYRALDRPEIADTEKNIAIWNDWIAKEGYPTYRLTVDGGDVDETSSVEQRSGLQGSGDDSYALYNIARARLQPVETLPVSVQGFVKWWEEFKIQHDMMDFSEMLEHAYEDVDTCPGKPQVLLMDEAQDTPKLGMRLAHKWGEQADWYFTVGDPLQNLYHWSGSDPEAFTNPTLPAEQQEVLAQSYRVPRVVRDYAFRWIEPHKLDLEQQMGTKIEYNARKDSAGDTVEGNILRCASATWKYPEPIIRDTMKYLEQGKEVMYLASCAYMLHPLIGVLRAQGIPFHNPMRLRQGAWNPLGSGRGTTASQRILSFLRLDERVYGEDVRMWNAAELWRWVEYVEVKRLLKRGSKELIKAAADKPMQFDEDGHPLSGELDLADLDQWFENLDDIINVAELIAEGNALNWLKERLVASKKKYLDYPFAIAQKYGPQRLKERPLVTVGTIHSVKGGESAVVALFPDISRASQQGWVKPGPDRDGVSRMFYVGMTRASETLILCQRASSCAITWPAVPTSGS